MVKMIKNVYNLKGRFNRQHSLIDDRGISYDE